ncbi:MAG: hypothetical protein C0483_01350 [Pirellula sp.]|nr:hypothetical protein [Pirellula sp.]
MSFKQQLDHPAAVPPVVATPSADATNEPAHQRGVREEVQERIERPLRAGVFADVAAADHVVSELVAAGFAPEEITVVCSEKSVTDHFRQFGHENPAGTFAPAAAAAGSVIGATLGGLAAIIGGVTTGGVGFLAAGGVALWSGGIVGGLIGAMLTRGVEPELANFYDQAVTQGKILVAVHTMEGTADLGRLNLADRIIREAGAESLPLPQG